MQLYHIPLVTIFLLVGSFVSRRAFVYVQLRRLLPPGPKGIPLLGNIFQIPHHFPWLRFTEWKEVYGPVFSLNIAGIIVIVLNTHQAATDLLDRKSTIYSDRPQTIMAGQILTGGYIMPLASYGERWRRLRRATHEALHLHAVEKYLPLQERESVRLISNILRRPDDWHDFADLSSASAALSMIYGLAPITSKDNPVVRKINQFMERVAHSMLPGSFLVDVFPWMMCLPVSWAKWKYEGNQFHKHDDKLFQSLIMAVYTDVSTGNFQPSFASTLVENAQRNNVSTKETAWLAGAMFSAGSHSTAATFAVFMLAMTLYPEAQARAQAEIDQVVGRSRLPQFGDREKMPFMACMVRECLRWRPVAPLGAPRRAVKDDWYNGYFIPKGSIVLFNTWAINRDTNVFKEPDEFIPERYMTDVGLYGVSPGMHTQGHAGYGYGRRICSGLHFANAELFINMSMMLWAFNITQRIGPDSKPIVPSRTDCIDEGLVVMPVPTVCDITPRFEDVNEIITEAIHTL